MLHDAGIDAIISGCEEESRQRRSVDAGYCYELFRRALEDNVQQAWTAIERQYRRLLCGWIGAGAGELPPHAIEEMAAEALAKFWRTLAQQPGDVLSRFPHVGALLRYLQQCAITTVLDYRRGEQRRQRLHARLALAERLHLRSEQVDEAAAQIDVAEELSRARVWLHTALADPQEKLVMELSLQEELSPAEIAERHPDLFADAQTVRRIKERVLKRARRALAAPAASTESDARRAMPAAGVE